MFMAAVILLFIATIAPAESDLEQRLNDQYKGKTLILRGFYTGGLLRYDSGGRLIGPAEFDDWTLSGIVQIQNIQASRDHLKVGARRIRMGWPGGVFQQIHLPGEFEEDGRTSQILHIEAALDLSIPESAFSAMSRIFLSAHDEFSKLVPDYWRTCVEVALSGEDDQGFRGCRFSPEFAGVPGMNVHSNDQGDEPEEGESIRASALHPGSAVAQPTLASETEPKFSYEARAARYEANTRLDMIIDKNGHPQDPEITTPAGMGLDKRAVEAVSQWRFEPATKQGQPVNFEVRVQIEFHLYQGGQSTP